MSGSFVQWLEHLDQEAFLFLNRALQTEQSSDLTGMVRTLNQLGDATTPVLVGILLFFVEEDGRRLVRRLAEWVASLVLIGMLVDHLKHAIGRARPQQVFESLFASGDLHATFGEHAAMNSMPSGHAATAWGMAIVLWAWTGALRQTWRRRIARAFIVFLASTVSLARVEAGMHWPGDVLAGALLGLACGYAVLWLGVRLWGSRWDAWRAMPSTQGEEGTCP